MNVQHPAPRDFLFRSSRSKYRSAHANFCRPFLDGHLEIVGHSHGENRQRAAQLRLQGIAQFPQSAKGGPYLLDGIEKRRDAHQTGEFEAGALSHLFCHFLEFCGFSAPFFPFVLPPPPNPNTPFSQTTPSPPPPHPTPAPPQIHPT